MPLQIKDNNRTVFDHAIKHKELNSNHLIIGGPFGIKVSGELTKFDLELISNFLQNHPDFIGLRIVDCCLSTDATALRNLMSNNTHIEYFGLQNVMLNPEHIPQLINIIEHNNIQQLCFEGIDFRNIDIEALSNSLRHNTSISVFRIDNCSLSDKQIKTLVTAILQRVTPYKSLYLLPNNISLNGLAMLSLIGLDYSHKKSPLYISLKSRSLRIMLKDMIKECKKNMESSSSESSYSSGSSSTQSSLDSSYQEQIKQLIFRSHQAKANTIQKHLPNCSATEREFAKPREIIRTLKQSYRVW